MNTQLETQDSDQKNSQWLRLYRCRVQQHLASLTVTAVVTLACVATYNSKQVRYTQPQTRIDTNKTDGFQIKVSSGSH